MKFCSAPLRGVVLDAWVLRMFLVICLVTARFLEYDFG